MLDAYLTMGAVTVAWGMAHFVVDLKNHPERYPPPPPPWWAVFSICVVVLWTWPAILYLLWLEARR